MTAEEIQQIRKRLIKARSSHPRGVLPIGGDLEMLSNLLAELDEANGLNIEIMVELLLARDVVEAARGCSEFWSIWSMRPSHVDHFDKLYEVLEAYDAMESKS